MNKKIMIVFMALIIVVSTSGVIFADEGAATGSAAAAKTATATAADKAKAATAAKAAKALKYQKGLAAYIRTKNGSYSKKSSIKLAGYFIKYGKKYNVSPLALMAMAQHESTFRAKAYNPSGCYGMMQTTASLGRSKGFSKRQLFTAKNSIKVAASYLKYNLKAFHNSYYKAFAGYCCGTYAVKSGNYVTSPSKARIKTMHTIKKYLNRHNYV